MSNRQVPEPAASKNIESLTVTLPQGDEPKTDSRWAIGRYNRGGRNRVACRDQM